ncbi:histidine phosphatase family protein [Fodinicurvata sp. EGI_FJ10296]|uniref:histidine phosphatase family protein n=1 Tax=Fodinicurvata sp. EGI_FJ10296 TaxID=3231908 RepID=UPI0034519C0C
MKTIEWWWIRHAPVIDPAETIYGRTDLAADIGSSAVAGSLDWLASLLPADAVWVVSPLQRTSMTARALADRVGVPANLVVDPELIEQHFGDWQGRPKADVYGTMGPDHPFWQAPATTPVPGGESFADVIDRIRIAIARLATSTAGPVIVVGHAGPIRAALAVALDLSPAAALRFHLDPLGLTRITSFLPASAGTTTWSVTTVNAMGTSAAVKPIQSNVSESE